MVGMPLPVRLLILSLSLGIKGGSEGCGECEKGSAESGRGGHLTRESEIPQSDPIALVPLSRRSLEMEGELKPVALTGNRDMAEDLERVQCPICGRTFAPSVAVRHQPICEKNRAKAEAKKRAAEA